MSQNARSEQEIFADLAALCASPGYVHALAFLCFRDNYIAYSGQMRPEDMQQLFSDDRLIRTELYTLVGLLIKNHIDYALPSPGTLKQYVDSSDVLLRELHMSLSGALFAAAFPKGANRPLGGQALREPIFYGGESAYSFQYFDLAMDKYAADDEWLSANVGFSIKSAIIVAKAIARLQEDRVAATVESMLHSSPNEWTLLPAYTFTADDISARSGVDKPVVQKIIEAFVLPQAEANRAFGALNDFNAANAWPIIPVAGGSYVLFGIYALAEALYDSPFYWMMRDKRYRNVATTNRGRYVESFSARRLESVFGKERVRANVRILDARSMTVGEIDVLVLFGDRAIVLQAKSKRLTIEARKGNDGVLRDDFKKAIQDACDQGASCANYLGDASYRLIDDAGLDLSPPRTPTRVYVFSVVADHYPGLSIQARHFLTHQRTKRLPPPFVLDVFTLDVLAEMLDTPLKFLSYVDRRTAYADRVMASHELVVLAYHLKKNLWLDRKLNGVVLGDDLAVELDVAMAVRRDNVPGDRSPEGVLTRLTNTSVGRLLRQIESRPAAETIELGMLLLSLSENASLAVSKGIDEILERSKRDGKGHDLTVGLGEAHTGLTIHCNGEPTAAAAPVLHNHCLLRKYKERATRWFGICVSAEDASLRFGVNLAFEWHWDPKLEALTRDMRTANDDSDPVQQMRSPVGRNDPCPCGSGLKYKRCCLSLAE